METKIISVRENDNLTPILKPVADIIKKGGLVVFPTETVYGIGADATDSSATSKIYEAKGRPSDNPLIIHIANPTDAEGYAFTNSLYYLLAEKFMPGPLTVILPARNTVPMRTRGGLETVAVRCPQNEVARELIRLSGVPIAAPSANLSGSPSPTDVTHVIDDMLGRVDVILDGGNCDFGLESTIIQIDSEKSVTLLRPGKITVEDLEACGISVNIAEAVTEALKSDERAISPGMKYKHYAPKTPLVLIEGDAENIALYLKSEVSSKIAVISYEEDMDVFKGIIPGADIYSFGRRDDETFQAHNLFKLLRDTDKNNYDIIYAPLPRTSGIGLALYNRMIRAAAHKIIRM